MKFLINNVIFIFLSGFIFAASAASAVHQHSLRGSDPISPAIPVEVSSVTGCSCDDITNVLTCDDSSSDGEEKCFCNEGGDLFCDEQIKLLPAGIFSVPILSSSRKGEEWYPKIVVMNQSIADRSIIPPTRRILSIPKSVSIEEEKLPTSCICDDDKTNVLSCDDSDDEEKCFCNEDGTLICDEPVIPPARIVSLPDFATRKKTTTTTVKTKVHYW